MDLKIVHPDNKAVFHLTDPAVLRQQRAVLHARDDLGNTSLCTGRVSNTGNGSSRLADDNTGFLGADECTEGERVLVGAGAVVLNSPVLGGLGGDCV